MLNSRSRLHFCPGSGVAVSRSSFLLESLEDVYERFLTRTSPRLGILEAAGIMASTSSISIENAYPTPAISANEIPTTTSFSTTEPVEPTIPTKTETIQPLPTTIERQTEPSSTTTSTKPPTPSTTTMTMTRQIVSSVITTIGPSTSIPDHIPDHTPLLSTTSSLVTIPTTDSGHSSSSMAPTTTSLISDTPSPTSNTRSATSNITGAMISRILPAVLVPIACLITILVVVLLVQRSRRRMRRKRTTQNPLPFMSQNNPPGLSSPLATKNAVINTRLSGKRNSLRQDSGIGLRGFVGNEGLGNERELRTREEASVDLLAGNDRGNDTVPGLREQIFVLQAQLADIETQHLSHAPPDYSSIDRE